MLVCRVNFSSRMLSIHPLHHEQHCQTVQDQFTFIHDAILESVTCGDTQISATNLRMAISKMKKKDAHNQPNGFQYQFKVGQIVHAMFVVVGCDSFLPHV